MMFSSIRIDVLNVICNLMFTMRMHWLNSRYGAVELQGKILQDKKNTIFVAFY